MAPPCRAAPPASWRNASGPFAQPFQPGGSVREGRILPPGWQPRRLAGDAARVGPEVADVGADPAQGGERVADPGFREVALGVEVEAVASQPLSGRAGLDPGQVDPP